MDFTTITNHRSSPIARMIVSAIILLIGSPAYSLDTFSYMSQADKPLRIDKPSWVDEHSRLRLCYEVNETYKKWLDNNKVTDFRGTSFNSELQINPVKNFAFGFTKKFMSHQSWINKEKKDMSPFDFDLKNHNNEAYVKLGSDHFKIMYGHIETNDDFDGRYELHEDIINALGSEPDINFNTKGTSDYYRLYTEHKKLRFVYSYEKDKYEHKIDASTDIMSLTINHKRKVRTRDYELSYNLNQKWFPYVRYSDYSDNGFGNDYRDNRVLIGRNNSYFKFVTRTIGTAYEYKNGWYYADYSRLFGDMSANIFFNMVNIDVLFFFSTRFVDYKTNFKPETGHMGRIGFKRHHRSISYAMQYSLAKLHGNTYKLGEKTKFNGNERDVQILNRSLYFHRMDIATSRPDNYGSWNIGLKVLVPYFKTHKPKTIEIPGTGGEAVHKPHKKYRGGWQLLVMREFSL